MKNKTPDFMLVFAGFLLASMAVPMAMALSILLAVVAVVGIIVRLIPVAIVVWLVWMAFNHFK